MRTRLSKEELRKLALWIRATEGDSVLVNNQLICDAQKAILAPERCKPRNYALISPITDLIKSLDATELQLFESTYSLKEHGVLDQRNGRVSFHPDEQEALVVKPLSEVRAKGEVKISVPSRPRIEPLPTEPPTSLLATLVELNRLVLRLYETPLSELARSSDLDKRRLRNLCVQATNGLSNFEEFL